MRQDDLPMLEYAADDFSSRARKLMSEGRGFRFAVEGEARRQLAAYLVDGRVDDPSGMVVKLKLRGLSFVCLFSDAYGMSVVLDEITDDVVRARVVATTNVPQARMLPGPHTLGATAGRSDLAGFQARFGLVLPPAHVRCLGDPKDDVHHACDFLVLEHESPLLRLVDVNEQLHARRWDPWPHFLVAFASNGCGDHFAYDTRSSTIAYVDPDHDVHANLASRDRLTYPSFEDWYANVVGRHLLQKPLREGPLPS